MKKTILQELDQQIVIAILEMNLSITAEFAYMKQYLFQEDNTRPHTVYLATITRFRNKRVPVLQWPIARSDATLLWIICGFCKVSFLPERRVLCVQIWRSSPWRRFLPSPLQPCSEACGGVREKRCHLKENTAALTEASDERSSSSYSEGHDFYIIILTVKEASLFLKKPSSHSQDQGSATSLLWRVKPIYQYESVCHTVGRI
ncbi:hypothetical protein TNCV_5002941 [Trichonephila clavipes]|nr:hypothetical protein TNCV_5002941 [Trichonephila clavipes]